MANRRVGIRLVDPAAIAASRNVAGLSIHEVAAVTGVRVDVLERYEDGRVHPSRQTLFALSECYGVEVKELLLPLPKQRSAAIAAVRELTGHSQKEFAAITGVALRRIERLEAGHAKLTNNLWRQLRGGIERGSVEASLWDLLE